MSDEDDSFYEGNAVPWMLIIWCAPGVIAGASWILEAIFGG